MSASGRETTSDLRRSLARYVSKSYASGTSPVAVMLSVDDFTSPRIDPYCALACEKSIFIPTWTSTLCLSVETIKGTVAAAALYGVASALTRESFCSGATASSTADSNAGWPNVSCALVRISVNDEPVVDGSCALSRFAARTDSTS